jgi:hypothetical protein
MTEILLIVERFTAEIPLIVERFQAEIPRIVEKYQDESRLMSAAKNSMESVRQNK